MTLSIVYRYRCDFPGCDQTLDREDDHKYPRDYGWLGLVTRSDPIRTRFHLCPHHAETDTTAEDLERIADGPITPVVTERGE